MLTTTDKDAHLYSMVHDLLLRSGNSQFDRRVVPRHACASGLLLAPYEGTCRVSAGAFRRVRCHDISPSGFGYIATSRSTHPKMIAALGEVPLAYFVVEVVHTTEILTGRRVHYLTGCRFLERLC